MMLDIAKWCSMVVFGYLTWVICTTGIYYVMDRAEFHKIMVFIHAE